MVKVEDSVVFIDSWTLHSNCCILVDMSSKNFVSMSACLCSNFCSIAAMSLASCSLRAAFASRAAFNSTCVLARVVCVDSNVFCVLVSLSATDLSSSSSSISLAVLAVPALSCPVDTLAVGVLEPVDWLSSVLEMLLAVECAACA